MADGLVRIVAAADFRERFPKVDPARLGLHPQTVLGQEAFLTYFDSEGRDEPFMNPDCAYGPVPADERYVAVEGRRKLNQDELQAVAWLVEQDCFTAWT